VRRRSYTDPVNEQDVQALLAHAADAAAAAAKRDALAKAAAKRSKKPDPAVAKALSKVLDIDALLSEERALGDTRFGCLRGYRFLLLLLPAVRTPAGAPLSSMAAAAAAAADDAVRGFALARLKQSIELYGGVVSEALTPETTHLVALPHAGWAAAEVPAAHAQQPAAPPPTRADVRAALAARGAGEAALLRHWPHARPLWLLSRDWLDLRLACADAAAAPPTPGGPPAPAPPSLLYFQLAEGPAWDDDDDDAVAAVAADAVDAAMPDAAPHKRAAEGAAGADAPPERDAGPSKAPRLAPPPAALLASIPAEDLDPFLTAMLS
jgi:hypothetical protein